MQKSGAKAYLVNTGWNGTGKRISIRDTRGIIDAILDHSIDAAPTKTVPFFNFVVPTQLEGVDPKILDPRDTYADASQWEEKAKDLAARFINNLKSLIETEFYCSKSTVYLHFLLTLRPKKDKKIIFTT